MVAVVCYLVDDSCMFIRGFNSISLLFSDALSKWFYDTSNGTATGAAHCAFLLRRALASWSLAINERGGRKDLCGLGRRNIIPYIHRRTGLYCSSPSCLCELEPFSTHRAV
jgi:hypothetical protein